MFFQSWHAPCNPVGKEAVNTVHHTEEAMKHTATITVLALSLALGGCIFAPDSGRDWDRDYDSIKPTIGQQLLDLDRAHEQGAINDAEYERAKDRILDNI
jgi:hypothetical protein